MTPSPTPVTKPSSFNWVALIQFLLSIAPQVFMIAAGVAQAINATPGTPEHDAALEKIANPNG